MLPGCMCGAEGAAAQIRPEESVCVFILQAVRTPSKEIPVSVCVCVTVPLLWIPLCLRVFVCVCRCVFTSPGTGRATSVNCSLVRCPHTASINEHSEGNVQTALSHMEVEASDLSPTK